MPPRQSEETDLELTCLRAGVSGLTTAYLLSQDPENQITVLAKHMPGDYDIEYASPWAGANYMPYGQYSCMVVATLN
jgi:D-amino-acid oxidase